MSTVSGVIIRLEHLHERFGSFGGTLLRGRTLVVLPSKPYSST